MNNLSRLKKLEITSTEPYPFMIAEFNGTQCQSLKPFVHQPNKTNKVVQTNRPFLE
jgi:hypothetical protein